MTETIRSLLADCPGQLNMTDDVLVYGDTKEEHQTNLMRVLTRLEECGITLNIRKCAFYRDEVTFFGLRFSKTGISPTHDRCRALREAAPPSNAKELRSLLGTAQFSARFIANLASISEPLWRLTKEGVKWVWEEEHERAFTALKQAISEKCLAYFNREWRTEVWVDASPVGLGAVLVQLNACDPADRRIVSFASRLLTVTERKYSQCEKEALAAVWGCEKFWLYLFGAEFTLVTDNRAVQLIFGPSSARPPARIERWALRLSQFDYTIVHRAGSSNIADFFSRQPDRSVNLDALVEQQASDRYINTIVEGAIPSSITRQEIARATNTDNELQALKRWLHQGSHQRLPSGLEAYKNVSNELSCAPDGILLRGRQIIIPASLRERVVDIAHRGHQGVGQTKAMIRARVWYVGIDAHVERRLRECMFCQTMAPKQAFEPLKPTPMPAGPWQSVAGDFFGPMDNGKYWYVNTCLYSRWFEVHEIASVAAEEVIPCLKQLFTTFGIPEKYTSVNGSPFQSHAFAQFACDWGFEHRRVTPMWPRANGAAESVMKISESASSSSPNKPVSNDSTRSRTSCARTATRHTA